jgi:hypothetical protein
VHPHPTQAPRRRARAAPSSGQTLPAQPTRRASSAPQLRAFAPGRLRRQRQTRDCQRALPCGVLTKNCSAPAPPQLCRCRGACYSGCMADDTKRREVTGYVCVRPPGGGSRPRLRKAPPSPPKRKTMRTALRPLPSPPLQCVPSSLPSLLPAPTRQLANSTVRPRTRAARPPLRTPRAPGLRRQAAPRCAVGFFGFCGAAARCVCCGGCRPCRTRCETSSRGEDAASCRAAWSCATSGRRRRCGCAAPHGSLRVRC